jgi:hypothetical protein
MMTVDELTTLLKTAPAVPTAQSVWLNGDGTGSAVVCYSMPPISPPPTIFTLDRSVLDGPDVLA